MTKLHPDDMEIYLITSMARLRPLTADTIALQLRREGWTKVRNGNTVRYWLRKRGISLRALRTDLVSAKECYATVKARFRKATWNDDKPIIVFGPSIRVRRTA